MTAPYARTQRIRALHSAGWVADRLAAEHPSEDGDRKAQRTVSREPNRVESWAMPE